MSKTHKGTFINDVTQLVGYTGYIDLKSESIEISHQIQAWIAQLVAHLLVTIKVVGSNPSNGEDFSLKI